MGIQARSKSIPDRRRTRFARNRTGGSGADKLPRSKRNQAFTGEVFQPLHQPSFDPEPLGILRMDLGVGLARTADERAVMMNLVSLTD